MSVCTLFPLLCWIWLSALADAREARLCRERFVLAHWTQALSVALAWLPLSTSFQLYITILRILDAMGDTKGIIWAEWSVVYFVFCCIDASVQFGLTHSSSCPGASFCALEGVQRALSLIVGRCFLAVASVKAAIAGLTP